MLLVIPVVGAARGTWIHLAAADCEAGGVSEPAALTVGVLGGQNVGDVLHSPLRRDPVAGDVREVDRTVRALLGAVESDGAPERLDVPQHLRPERPDAGHPIAVE